MKAIYSLLGLLILVVACAGEHSDAQPGVDEGATPPATDERQADVAARGAEVMPFDLDRTTHVFAPTEDGGLQTVRSEDGDEEQIRLIREHLRNEAERFAQGDFHDPAMIHGSDMPGLHTLVMGADRLTVEYQSVEGGGEIRYASSDEEIIAAIHEWFAAQVSDHGAHAQGGHEGGADRGSAQEEGTHRP